MRCRATRRGSFFERGSGLNSLADVVVAFVPNSQQAEFNALSGDLARQYPDRARLWFAYDEPLRCACALNVLNHNALNLVRPCQAAEVRMCANLKGFHQVVDGCSGLQSQQCDFIAIMILYSTHSLPYTHLCCSHLIYAGCDMFLVPSMFEPCGLTQVGAAPRARKFGIPSTLLHVGVAK